MKQIITKYFLATFACCLAVFPARSQPAWSPVSLTNSAITYAGPGFYYTDPIFVRSGQQAVIFDLGPTAGANASKVRVDGGSWQNLGAGSPYITWPNPPTVPGVYEVDFIYVGPGNPEGDIVGFTLTVVPAATARFGDGLGNTLVFWKGGAYDDHPLLMVEGIDAENKNSANSYFALASDLLSQAIPQGADVYVLNFSDGGRDLRLNADIVESAVNFLNSSRRATQARLDVAGVSMGGVVTRIALARMEEEGQQHRVDNFLSIDAPQDGAVLQHSLVDFIQSQVNQGRIEAPKNLTSKAGRQLLEYNVYAFPSESNSFFNEINQINGDGYPHLSTNLGVSFGTRSSSPHNGDRWASFEIRSYSGVLIASQDFNITNEVAVPGSHLPADATKVWGYSCPHPGLCGVGLIVRNPPKQPAFIPTVSALHETAGVSQFDETMTAASPSFHDRLPNGLANRILDWLGYQVPPLTVFASGPNCIRDGGFGVYSADASGGAGPFSYTWTMKPTCLDGHGLLNGGEDATPDGPIEPMGPSCSKWNQIGTGQVINYMPSSASVPFGTLQIRAEVTDSRNVTMTSNTIFVSFVPNDSPAPCGGISGQSVTQESLVPERHGGTGLSRSLSVPKELVLQGGSPNPFSSSTQIVFGLPGETHVRLTVYDLLGREVARLTDDTMPAGWHRAPISSSHLPPGVYLVRMQAGKRIITTAITRVQ